MSIIEIVTGDDVALSVTLKKDNSTFDIDSSATIHAAIVSETRSQLLLDAVVQSNSASGADWDNSLVIIEFSSTETSNITTAGRALLEIQVDDNGKQTWFVSVRIVKGNIA